jgi:hypothetical protein
MKKEKNELGSNDEVPFDNYRNALCYKSPKELKRYVCRNRKIWSNIDKSKIKQVEALFPNEVYVLTNDGKLYENGEFILVGISELWSMNIRLLFVVTNDNYVYSIQDTKFNDYIGNIKYKKIVKSGLDLLALTYDNKVKALTSYPEFIGIIPDNFNDVDDIFIYGDELGTPMIVKNGEKIPLYVSD